ncbi:hypothetical protein DPMN_127674 [Dreissena polymorpha]|uniref:Uncharacterized protein n=1 Tax=Dreissena polymorpha TaxID=45954 RepID=A0A9D4IWM0_DREPO|nr:hypothetical protein DPMN_162380 [Dreissena polymorpha]KAH3790986.1 hypothetical protein DPMN_169195 [Dreissena polymorpha]KAH3817238.1 hypothetical protein DPMN_118770 [Dreissena polymorpha]KAH3825794.1 hypothetical protein DPMN_127674 [Dreissena polymorpha]
MQRTCHPLFIVESSPARTCQRSRLKRAGDGGTARPPVWGTYGTDLGLALLRRGEPKNIEGVALKRDPGAAVPSALNALGKPSRG